MTLRSLAPCLRAAREKHRFAAGKNIGTEKSTFGSRKKTPCSGKKLFPQRGKNASKKCRFAAGKIQSSRKNTLQQHKSTFAAEKMHFGGKNRPRQEKSRPRQEKNRPRQEKNQQQRKSSFATQKVAAMEKIHFRNGKKQQPTVKGVLADLELRVIEFFSEWLVALLMPARHVLETRSPHLSFMLLKDYWFKEFYLLFFSVQRLMASARSFNMFPSMLQMRLIN